MHAKWHHIWRTNFLFLYSKNGIFQMPGWGGKFHQIGKLIFANVLKYAEPKEYEELLDTLKLLQNYTPPYYNQWSGRSQHFWPDYRF